MIEAALFLSAYLVGAIPFGYLIARAHGVDIFSVGSGNVGATNVKRALGLGWALAVFVLDVAKGAIPAMIAWQLKDSQVWAMAVGVSAIAGHCLSPFLKFRGGKGIATTLGVVLASSPMVALSALLVFLVSMAVCRWVSLSSMVALFSALIFAWLLGDSPTMYGLYAALAVFVVIRHRGNIRRLLDGTEPKFSLRDPSQPPAQVDPDAADEEDPSERSFTACKPYGTGGQSA